MQLRRYLAEKIRNQADSLADWAYTHGSTLETHRAEYSVSINGDRSGPGTPLEVTVRTPRPWALVPLVVAGVLLFVALAVDPL